MNHAILSDPPHAHLLLYKLPFLQNNNSVRMALVNILSIGWVTHQAGRKLYYILQTDRGSESIQGILCIHKSQQLSPVDNSESFGEGERAEEEG
jgi:hypothetical protein